MAMQISSAEAVLKRPEPRAWVEGVARLGYIVKGSVYGIMAALALQAALDLGGRIASEREAVEHIGRLPTRRQERAVF